MKSEDAHDRNRYLEEAQRWYAALQAGVGDGANVVHNIRENLGLAGADVTALIDESHKRTANEIERELQSAHDTAIREYRARWRSPKLKLKDKDDPGMGR